MTYEATAPKQFGNLHERMKYVMALLEAEKDNVSDKLWHAVFDLETEVKFHTPAEPPYGRRPR